MPFEFEQDDQFFQNPIVRARPPGGGVLSTVNVLVWPDVTLKSTQTVRLFTFGFGSDGGMMLFGTNSGPSPARLVFQPGNTHSQSWYVAPGLSCVVKLMLPLASVFFDSSTVPSARTDAPCRSSKVKVWSAAGGCPLTVLTTFALPRTEHVSLSE